MNCTGKNCPMQVGCVEPATCKCADYCPDVTRPIGNEFHDCCPSVMRYIDRIVLNGDCDSTNMFYYVRLLYMTMMLGEIFVEKGRSGLRELEESYKQNPWSENIDDICMIIDNFKEVIDK